MKDNISLQEKFHKLMHLRKLQVKFVEQQTLVKVNGSAATNKNSKGSLQSNRPIII